MKASGNGPITCLRTSWPTSYLEQLWSGQPYPCTPDHGLSPRCPLGTVHQLLRDSSSGSSILRAYPVGKIQQQRSWFYNKARASSCVSQLGKALASALRRNTDSWGLSGFEQLNKQARKQLTLRFSSFEKLNLSTVVNTAKVAVCYLECVGFSFYWAWKLDLKQVLF